MEIDIKQVLLQITNFAIVLYFLKKFLYKPILGILSQREQKINKGLESAEENIQKEAESEKKVKVLLTEARKDAVRVANKSSEDARKQAKTILTDAKLRASQLIKKQEKNLQEEYKAKEKALNKQLGKLVIETTKTTLSSVLSSQDVERITKSTIKKLR